MSAPALPTRRRIRRTKLFLKINRELMERRSTDERLRSDMRRYLRNLLNRKAPLQEGAFSLLWSTRPQFGKRTFIEIDPIIKQCAPAGWDVQTASTVQGDEFTGWNFVKLKPQAT